MEPRERTYTHNILRPLNKVTKSEGDLCQFSVKLTGKATKSTRDVMAKVAKQQVRCVSMSES